MIPSQMNTHVEDPRFAELLRPIKDLTANFNIPLSQFLDTYFLDLRDGMSDHLSSPLDTQSKVNFVQAGLFLQGSASVYSKKVEFLWQNVLQMLEFLSQRQSFQDELHGASSSSSSSEERLDPVRKRGSNQRKKDLFSTDFGFLPSAPSQKTILEPTEETPRLKFIPVTPCQLIQKEGKETVPFHVRVNIYAKGGEILGPKEDFRVNAQYCSHSGVIGQGLLGPSDHLHHLSISLCQNDQASVTDPHIEESLHLDERRASSPEPLVENMASIHEEEALLVDQSDCLRRSKRKAIKDTILEEESVRPSLADIWEPIQPNDAPSHPAKSKMRRSNLLSKEKTSSDLKKSSTNVAKKTLSEYFNNAKQASHRPKRVSIALIPPELTKEAFDEEKRRKSLKKKILPVKEIQDQLDKEDAGDNNNEEDEEEQPWEDNACFTDPHDPLPMNPPSLLVEVPAPDSYEEIVLKKVGNYVTQSQEYIKSSELSKRVAAWHEHIRPKLEAVEARGSFNIHSYGTKVIDSFPNDNRKSTISFKSIVEGVEREEVSRYFLSCLMLANTSNLELESQGMNDLNLTLLTKKRHHEELMASPEPVLGSFSGSRKRVMPPSPTVDDCLHDEVMDELDAIPDSEVKS